LARIIVLVAGVDPVEDIGAGHTSYVRAHARAVARAGFEPHIFCAGRSAAIVETDLGVIHRIGAHPRTFRNIMAPVHGRFVAGSLERFLQERPGPHLIHSFGAWSYVGVFVSQALQRRGVEATPIASAYTTLRHESHGKVRGLTSVHGRLRRLRERAEHLWVRLVADRYERRGYAGSRLVIVNYESVGRLLLEMHRLKVEIRKLPYTAESAFLRTATAGCPELPNAIAALRPKEAPLVVAISRHDPRKGIDVLLRALARLRADGVPFRACLVGRGLLLADHRHLADRLGLGDVTAIPGRVPDSDAYLRPADIFVLPSLEEGSGSLALIEALQAGVAVVASNIDGIPEDVVDGDSALLVEPGNPAALCEALRRVLADARLRRALARRARQTFLEKFTAEGFVDVLRKTYAELGVEP